MPRVLRRTISTPSVRAAPYTYPVSSVVSSSSGRRRRGASDAADPGYAGRRSPQRSTGARQILAEIDWWSVIHGQRESQVGHEVVDEDSGETHDGDERPLFPRRLQRLSPTPSLQPVPENPVHPSTPPYGRDNWSDSLLRASRSSTSRASSRVSDGVDESGPATPRPTLSIFPRYPSHQSFNFPNSPAPLSSLLTPLDTAANIGVYTHATPLGGQPRVRSISSPDMICMTSLLAAVKESSMGNPSLETPLIVPDDISASGI
ncbi:hypothetical protein M422DRAFT_55535 [Sphaerobolus stellatus SS14]|uniref:Uncharacterized protein n=1 Tax=Sphaerobolus stellatus (strain SS14) TaxID=990650 RepID=A0A0C9TBH9_SPHS4|nr:hypothetical protein M422DRAFT_55535 [Sphaerobolus stellatus SS14]